MARSYKAIGAEARNLRTSPRRCWQCSRTRSGTPGRACRPAKGQQGPAAAATSSPGDSCRSRRPRAQGSSSRSHQSMSSTHTPQPHPSTCARRKGPRSKKDPCHHRSAPRNWTSHIQVAPVRRGFHFAHSAIVQFARVEIAREFHLLEFQVVPAGFSLLERTPGNGPASA